jgi:hypothetical protein
MRATPASHIAARAASEIGRRGAGGGRIPSSVVAAACGPPSLAFAGRMTGRIGVRAVANSKSPFVRRHRHDRAGAVPIWTSAGDAGIEAPLCGF